MKIWAVDSAISLNKINVSGEVISMNVLPPVSTNSEIDPSGQYHCPLCKIQTTSDEADIGWVSCPMLDATTICLGCCLDYQTVARSVGFDGHLFRDLFDEAARITKREISELRRICLHHQRELLESKQLEPMERHRKEELSELIHQIYTLEKSI